VGLESEFGYLLPVIGVTENLIIKYSKLMGVASAVDALQDVISEALVRGEKVALTGFGTFQTSDRKARTGINPATGEKIQIAACTVPKFVVGKSLKDKVK